MQQFDYDAFGNRVSSNLQRVTGWSGVKGASTAYVTASTVPTVINAALSASDTALWQKNQLPATTSAGVLTGAVYDAQGNLTQIFEKPGDASKSVTMVYDALGRVIQLSSSKTGITEKYQYTAEGLRAVIEERSGTTLLKTRVNLYNDGRQLVSQYEKAAAGTLAWKRDIVYLGTREAAEFDAAGMHVTQVDHLGSPRIVTGPTGLKESQQKYLPYGELLEQSDTFKSSKGYTNHEQTDASGLIYMQARFYVPWFGRFASPDPAMDQHFENTQSWNIYSYVRNSPIMSTDPTGMQEAISVPNQKGADNDETGMQVGLNEEQRKEEQRKREEAAKAQTKTDALVGSVPVEVKRAIQKSLDASNAPTEDDKTGRFHEEGGQWGKGVDGNVLVYPAVPGKVSKPGDKEASVDSGQAVDQQGKINNLATTDGKWHIHPMGDGLNGKRGFLQGPSPGDLKRPADEFLPTNIVVGAASRRVYFYDAKGVVAEVGLSDFMKGVN
ncbi:MAG: RHS repeat-associated core domain-containing protein [Geothrix sp.]|nr:RHS repeat-associated core domain-containing protein [Geothrix sp.]